MITVKSLSLGTLALVSATAFGQDTIRVVVDNNPVQFADQQPAMSGGSVLVPLRGVFETLGAKVEWDPATQSITARKGDTRIKLAIGQFDASVNGKPYHLSVAATLVGGSTMVPLRFVSEALGAYVTWDGVKHEVDITSATHYDFHRKDDDHDRRTPPPPPIIKPTPPPARHEEPKQEFGVIAIDTVIPFVLNTRLSSNNAQVGDQFTANLVTDGSHHYFDLPGGTVAYGAVSFARPQRGQDAGILELKFDHMVLPNGRNVAIIGRLIGLDDKTVKRLPNGAIMARSPERDDRVVFTGYLGGTGLIVGVHAIHPVQDKLLGSMLEAIVPRRKRDPQLHDVELRPGTQLGVRLYQNMMVPKR